MQASKTAIKNLRARIECKDYEKWDVLFEAAFDKNVVFELGCRRYDYKWLQYHNRQHAARKASYSNFFAEAFDNETFRYTYEFSEEGLPNTVAMHSLATVDPHSKKIVRVKTMTCEAATQVFRFHRRNHVEFDSDSTLISNMTRDEIEGSGIRKLDDDTKTATKNNQRYRPSYGYATKGHQLRKRKPKQRRQREPITTALFTERIKNDISASKKLVSSLLSSSPGSIYSVS